MTTSSARTASQPPRAPGTRVAGVPRLLGRRPLGDDQRSGRRLRWQLVPFLALAYGLSWWPSLARIANPDAAPVLPIGPSIAAILVLGWVSGWPAVRSLLRSAVDARVGRWWWTAVVPAAVAAVTAILAVLFGADAPSGSDIAMAAVNALVTLPIILVLNGPLGEELGWRGYVLPMFLRRHSPVTATFMLIPLWIGFHLPLILISPDRFGFLWALTVVGMAFTMTWLHLGSGGSVLLAIVFHAVVNTSMPAALQLFSGADRQLAIRIIATLWLVVGAAIAAGPLRRAGRRPH